MKPHPTIAAVLALVLCICPLCVAQTSVDCDTLREKINTLKAPPTTEESASTRQVKNKALADLYAQLLTCIDGEIKAVTDIRNTVAGTNAVEAVDKKLGELRDERASVVAELAQRTGTNIANVAASVSAAASTGPGNTFTQTQTNFPCVPGEAYPDAPPLLTDIVGKAALDIATSQNPGLSGIPNMFLYTTIDAASPTSSQLLRGLEAYQYLSETARTDKQLGGPSNSNAAVSAIEKPGFVSLLGLAVEHGAIDKKTDGTNLTLSTSLYSLYVIGKENTAETYQQAGVLNRIGAAATFAVDNTTDDLANARRNNLSQWSVKARLFGDRSTRSKQFQKKWNDEIAPLIDARLEALGAPLEELTESSADYKSLRTQVANCLRRNVVKRTEDTDYKAATTEGRTKMITDVLLSLLRSNVYNRIKTGQLQLSDKIVTAVETRYVPNLKAALDNLKKAGGELDKAIEDLKAGPLATFAYTNFRIPTGSDYSETKFLFEQDKGFFGPLKLTGNVGLSFYHRPDHTLNQDRVRDFSTALSFSGTSDSPFTEAENKSKITYSFVGRYQRLFENRRVLGRTADIGTLQFVTEIPLFKGLSLPFSVTYSSATEEEKKQGFRFNFGTRLDMDKLFDLLKANSNF